MSRSPRLVRGKERSRSIPASSLHAIHRLAAERTGHIIALHVGEPHIAMPDPVAEAYIRAIHDRQTFYTDAPGLPALRAALATALAENGAPSPDRIFVTPGSCQALSAVLHSVAIPGGTALLPEIHWPMHLQQVLLAGLTPRFYPSQQMGLSPAAWLESMPGPAPCAVIVNSPANPTGGVLERHVVRDLHSWAVRNHVWLICDEAYEDFVYTGEAPRMAALDTCLPERERVVFSVHTFSKSFSMTGCRLGYVAVPTRERATLLQRVQEATLVAPSTPVQFAGLAALEDRDHPGRHRAYVEQTRDDAVGLLGPAGLLPAAPQGGWYTLVDLTQYTADSEAFCRDLLADADVALAPGTGFAPVGDPRAAGMVRIALCGEREATLEGIGRLLAYLPQRAR